jgi:chemotaxis protein histidine kinase CheA
MPFKGETEYQILNQIVNDDVPPPSTVVPSYPPALAAVVMKALQRDPDKRYVNALELQSAVEDFAHESRLRVSPLVLARLMGTLFPARLEEWDHAKAQGAFFVEQHVVRTLIESGRTPDRSDPVVQAQVAAAAVSDDDPTQINTTFNKQHLAGDGSDSVSAATTPSIPSFANQRPSSQPQAYPVMGAPGVLVSSTAPSTIAVTPGPTPFTPHGAVQVTPPSIDVTERVRAPVAARQTSPTKFVRTGPSRKGVFILASLFAIAGGIAVFIVTRGSDAPVSSPSQEPTSLEAKPEAKPPETPEAKPAAEIKPEATAAGAEPSNAAGSSAAANDEIEIDEPAKAEPVAEKGEPAKAEPVTEKVEPAKTEPVAEKVEPTKAEPVATKTEPKKTIVAKRPKAKTEPKKTPPKEKTWNSDSPFMPVRTGK